MPQVRQSPFTSPNNEVNKNTKIVIKSNGNIEKRSESFRHSQGFDNTRMSGNQSDILSMRDSNQNPLPGRNNSHYSKTMEKASLKQPLTMGAA